MTKKKTGSTEQLLAVVGATLVKEEMHRTGDRYEVRVRVRRSKRAAWSPAYDRTSLQCLTNWMLIYEFLDTFGGLSTTRKVGAENYKITKRMSVSEFDKLIKWVDAGIITARLT